MSSREAASFINIRRAEFLVVVFCGSSIFLCIRFEPLTPVGAASPSGLFVTLAEYRSPDANGLIEFRLSKDVTDCCRRDGG